MKDAIGFVAQLTTPAWKWAVAILAGCAAYVFPEQVQRDMAVAAFGSILLDTLTGVVAAIVTGRAVKSSKFGRVFVKLFGYCSTLLVVCWVGRYVTPNSQLNSVAVTTALTLILSGECHSVLENVHRMGLLQFKFLERLLKGRVAEIENGQEEQA